MDAEPEAKAAEAEVALGGASGPMRPVVAFDVGDKRIGIAVSDELGNAQPLLTLYRKTPRADLKSIGRLLRKHEIAEAVVGNPLNMSGEAGPRALKSQVFAEQLRVEFGLPVHLMDERLTTWQAHQLLDEAGRGRRSAEDRCERRRIIDQVAAVLILQSFLDARAGREAVSAQSARAAQD